MKLLRLDAEPRKYLKKLLRAYGISTLLLLWFCCTNSMDKKTGVVYYVDLYLEPTDFSILVTFVGLAIITRRWVVY